MLTIFPIFFPSLLQFSKHLEANETHAGYAENILKFIRRGKYSGVRGTGDCGNRRLLKRFANGNSARDLTYFVRQGEKHVDTTKISTRRDASERAALSIHRDRLTFTILSRM